ncbi:MAG: glycosyltransferase family 4 protein [Pseudomonadota bacterium]
MNKKILSISNHSYMLGGGEFSLLSLLSHLPPPWSPIAVVPAYGELARLLQKAGVKTDVVPLSTIRPWSCLQVFKTIRSVVDVCRKTQPLLIHANGSRAALYACLSKPFHGLPVVWHCRISESDPHLDFLLERLSDRIVANSQATSDRFAPCVQPKVRVVYNGVDIEWLKDRTIKKPGRIQDDWKVLLTVARVSRMKNHDIVLSAFEHVAASDPKLHLVCLGSRDASEPEWWETLQMRTLRSPFSKRIHWVDHVEDVRPWYEAAHISVLASVNESFGRVLIEAMACGVPVVATQSGGVPEIIRHGKDGLLVVPGKVDKMAEAMAKILTDEPLRERLVRSARKRANFFSLDAHVANMVKVFEDTIRRGS